LADRDTGRNAGVCTDPIGIIHPYVAPDGPPGDVRSPVSGPVSIDTSGNVAQPSVPAEVRSRSMSPPADDGSTAPSSTVSSPADDGSTTPSSTISPPVVKKRSLNPIQYGLGSSVPAVRPDPGDLSSTLGERHAPVDRCYCGSRSS
jgi:hypothetical protein